MKAEIPIMNPKMRVTSAACFVPLFQRTPQRNTVVMGGASSEAMAFMASKMLE